MLRVLGSERRAVQRLLCRISWLAEEDEENCAAGGSPCLPAGHQWHLGTCQERILEAHFRSTESETLGRRAQPSAGV